MGKALTRADIEALAADPSPCHLSDCDLESVDLPQLQMTGWTFERCDLRRATLTGARIDQSRWLTCRGAFANFSGADLSESLFQSSDFNNAVFRRSILTSTSFLRCKLTGADLSDARAMDVGFSETLLISAKLPGFSFRKRTLNKVDFSQADLRKCDFRATQFDDCSLRDAHMVDCRFEDADLRGADLGGLRLIDARLFRGATISRAQAGQLLGELGLKVS
ncbi:pentapeptide repeat-containing protein [Sphingobium aromaticiconvertens]|uniref:pentapeptide repeat-containing protein n=1 Tax=Sphingobium aromaticiconvertens TaxID=365341 RepID=UPI003019E8D8